MVVGSGKGGVGKSTTTTQLVHRFARDGVRVGVIDADAYQPSILLMLGVGSNPAVHASAKSKIVPIKAGCNNNISLISLGLWLAHAQAVVWSAAMGIELLQQFLYQTDWSACDLVLIDMPPGTGEMHSFVMQAVEVQSVVLVTTGQSVAQQGVRRFAKMADVLGIPIAGYVLNMRDSRASFKSILDDYTQLGLVHWNSDIAQACDAGQYCHNEELSALYQKVKEMVKL